MNPLKSFSSVVIIALALLLSACGQQAELRPELQAHLEEYDRLIETYQPKFAEAGGDRAQFAHVSDSYSRDVQAWMSQWDTVAPNMSDEEGKAVKARIDKLNKRAVRMLRVN